MISFSEFAMDDVVRFELNGRLDAAGADQIEAPLTASVRKGDRNVLIDLADVPFVGSLGIRVLVMAARILQRAGRTMVLTGVQPQVMDVFETVSLGELIPIAANPDEARQKLGA